VLAVGTSALFGVFGMQTEHSESEPEKHNAVVLSHRSWLRQSVIAAAAFSSTAARPYTLWARSVGANDAVSVAVAGLRLRGAQLIKAFDAIPGVHIAALCDVDSDVLGQHTEQRKKVRQAGKDVYVEKPVSHNIWDGRQMVTAARKHNRIVQCGSQNRSDVGFQEAGRL
jgi:hypothetical protein